MSGRIVTNARIVEGRLRALCNPEEWWSPRTVEDVIVDIESRSHTYFVVDSAGRLGRLSVVKGSLRVRDRFGAHRNLDLPDC